MRKIILYIALLVSVSCKKEIIIDIEDKPSVLVVNAVIDPDSFFCFNLSMTQNITDNSPVPYVNNASVEIFNFKDTSLVQAISTPVNGDYLFTVKPEPGKQYYFRINTLQGPYWVYQRMPDTVHCSIVDTTRIIIFQGKPNFFQVSLKLEDDTGKNYYGFRIKRFFETINGLDTVRSEEWLSLETQDFVLTENPKTKFSKKNLLFTDEFFDAPVKELKIGASGLFSTTGQRTRKLVIYTSSYSKSGYDYYTSVNEHLFYQNDPFSQPTLLSGNIPGAFGAAVGRYTRVDTINFK